MAKRKNNSHIEVVSLSKYTTPVVSEVPNKEWVSYGEDNNYFQWLIDRSINSTTNGAIINSMSRMIYGKGLDATDSNKKPSEFAQMKSIFSKKDLRAIVSDRKKLGMAAIQINYKGRKVKKALHFPTHTLRAEKCNEDGEIEAWYYHPNWFEIKPQDKPKRIAAFGFGNGKENEIYILKPYVAGFSYYPPVDYKGALPYAVLEEEIADYLVNDVLNGFSGTKVVNFNNGEAKDEDTRRRAKRAVINKLTGSTGEKVIIAFNDSKEEATTVDSLPLDDAPAHYEYLSRECQEKLLIGHRVTSPMLLGIRTGNNGLGNNADEIKTASLLFDNSEIRPFQDELLDAVNEILAVNNIVLNTYFKTIQPLEFTDLDNVEDEETKEEETGVKMSADTHDLSEDKANSILENLKDDVITDEWEEVESRESGIDDVSIEEWANKVIKPKKTVVEKFSSLIKSKPSGFSYLDKSQYKVRYRYSERHSSENSRDFCKHMMSKSKKGNVYRLEDIDKASRDGVNKSHGHKGQPYDLFKYKGGVSCSHYWSEVLYRLKSTTKKGSDKLYDYKETSSVPASYKPKPKGNRESKIAPKDMPNNGHHPNYKK